MSKPTGLKLLGSHLWNGVRVANHVDDVIQWQEGVAFDLGEDVLAHGAAGQQPDQLDVVPKRRAVVHPDGKDVLGSLRFRLV